MRTRGKNLGISVWRGQAWCGLLPHTYAGVSAIARMMAFPLLGMSTVGWGADRFFDVNGVVAGSGVVGASSYNWDATTVANWSGTDGTGPAIAFGSGHTAIFSAGTDAAGLSYAVNLAGAVTATALQVQEGNLSIGGTQSLLLNGGNATSIITVASGASLTVGSGVSIVYSGTPVNIANNSANVLTLNGAISSGAARTLAFTGSGTGGTALNGVFGVVSFTSSNSLAVNTTGGTTTLSAANVHKGATTLTQGTLELTNSAAIKNSPLFYNGGTLRLNFGAGTWENAGLAGAVDLALQSADPVPAAVNLHIIGDNSNVVLALNNVNYTGVLSGPTSTVTKGNSLLTQTFSGANTYGGGTTLNAGQLNLNNGGTASSSAIGTGAFTVNGGTIDNTSGAPVSLQTNNTQTWNASFAFGGSNDLDLGTGTVNLAGGTRTVTTNGTGVLKVGGVVSNGALSKAGTGTLLLSGNNVGVTSVTITSGTLALGHNAAIGNGTFTLSGTSTVRSDSTATRTIANAMGNLTGSNVVVTLGSTSPSLNGDLDFNNATGWNLGATAVRTLQVHNDTNFVGGLGGNAGTSLVKTGDGTLSLGGAGGYGAGTTITAGTLLANATTGSSVGGGDLSINGGTLGGSGIVGASNNASRVTFTANGGTIAPGLAGGDTGRLVINGSVDFSTAGLATFDVQLNGPLAGTTYDQLRVNATTNDVAAGDVNLAGAQLSIALGFTPTLGQSFTLIDKTWLGPINGVFLDRADNSFFTVGTTTFRIDYDGGPEGGGNDVVLTVVPEPASMALLLLSAATLLTRRRRSI